MKRIWIIMITLLFAVSLAACNSDSLGEYKKAVEKTDNIKRGKTSGEFLLVMDFNTEGMTSEQIKELNYYKDMKGSFSVVFDDDLGKNIFRNYLNFGGLGFDFDLFVNGDEVFMKLPVVGKYLRIDQTQSTLDIDQEMGENPELISKETGDEISTLWLGLMNKEDVFKGRNIVLATPDGEVKTTEYTIKLSDMQIKSLAHESIDILSKDEKLKESFEKYIKKNVDYLKDESLGEVLSYIKEAIKDYNVESFSYTAYVDIDGYIVNEIVEVSVKVENPQKAAPASINYKLDIKNWDINRKQEFDFPQLTEENTLDIDEMDDSMPFMMKDLLKNKD